MMRLRYGLVLLGELAFFSAHAADRIELSTRVSGVVEDVLVSVGQKVKKGDLLLRLNKVIYRARIDEASADFDRTHADETDARSDLERAQELYSRTVSSTTELDAAKLRYNRAKSALSAAEARLRIAKINLADTELKAPIDGVIAALPAAPGVVVAAECQPRPFVWMSR